MDGRKLPLSSPFYVLWNIVFFLFKTHFHFWTNYPLGTNVKNFKYKPQVLPKLSSSDETLFEFLMCVCVWEAAWSALPCHVWWHTVGQCSDWRSHSQSLFCAVSKQLARMDLPLPPARETRWSLRPHKHNTVSSQHAHTEPIMERCFALISCSSASQWESLPSQLDGKSLSLRHQKTKELKAIVLVRNNSSFINSMWQADDFEILSTTFGL